MNLLENIFMQFYSIHEKEIINTSILLWHNQALLSVVEMAVNFSTADLSLG